MSSPDQIISILRNFSALNSRAFRLPLRSWPSPALLCRFALLSLICLLILIGLSHQRLQAQETSTQKLTTKAKEQKLTYPLSRRSDHVDHYHKAAVPDPYRWLEDLDSEETERWVKDQNQLTFGFLKQIPQREALAERLTKLWNYERFGVPYKKGGRYFYTRNEYLLNR